MATRFEGKVCLITGAASGIGRATAQKMNNLGAHLSLGDIDSSGLEESERLCAASRGRTVVSRADVSDTASCRKFIDDTIQAYGRLDYVFNCAGVNPTAYPLTETTDEYWDKLVDTNLKGTYAITRAAIPHLVESGPGSAIVNVSSIMGLTVAAEYAIYCATKFGIVGFTKAMAMEMGGKGVRVNAVCPGYIATPTNAGVLAGEKAVKEQEARVAMGRMGTPEEVADVVAFLFRWVFGARWRCDSCADRFPAAMRLGT